MMFITLEGIDGAGKSTHIQTIVDELGQAHLPVLTTREPGGTPLGEQLRKFVLCNDMHSDTEALLMFAARKEHMTKVIAPALAQGQTVVCDRFTDATFAYQGTSRGVSWEKLEILENWVQGNFQPDLTLIFDLAPALAVQRVQQRAAQVDKFELKPLSFFNDVRNAYLKRAHMFPKRCRVIDASQSIDKVAQWVRMHVQSALTAAKVSD